MKKAGRINRKKQRVTVGVKKGNKEVKKRTKEADRVNIMKK